LIATLVGAFGDGRLFAAAFENGRMCPFFKDSLESGSKLPHSERPPQQLGGQVDVEKADEVKGYYWQF